MILVTLLQLISINCYPYILSLNILMHESDEMFTKMIARFGAKAFEKKKEKDFVKHLAAKAE